MLSMSFATPGMTNDLQGTNMQTQEHYFSNTGQIDFRPGVKIYHADHIESTPSIVNEDIESSKVSFALKNNEEIVAKLTPISKLPDDTKNVNNLTVAENSKRLARMICDMSAENEQEYTTNAHKGLHESVNFHAAYGKYNNLRSNVKTADSYNHDKFDLLVREFIDNGSPDLHAWINMNPKRQMMTYGEALAVHETLADRAKRLLKETKEKAEKMKAMAKKQWNGDGEKKNKSLFEYSEQIIESNHLTYGLTKSSHQVI